MIPDGWVHLGYWVLGVLIGVALYQLWLSLHNVPARIHELDGQCPACGNRGRKLQYQRHKDTPYVTSTCNICSFQWYEDVVKFCDKPVI